MLIDWSGPEVTIRCGGDGTMSWRDMTRHCRWRHGNDDLMAMTARPLTGATTDETWATMMTTSFGRCRQ